MRRFSAFLLVFCLFFCDCGGAQHQKDQQPELIPDEQAMNAQLKKQQEEEEKKLARVRKLVDGDHVIKKDVAVCNELPVAPGRYLFKKTGNICQIRPDRKRSLYIQASHFYRIIEQIEDERERKRTQSFFSRMLEEEQQMPRVDQRRGMFRIKVNGKDSP